MMRPTRLLILPLSALLAGGVTGALAADAEPGSMATPSMTAPSQPEPSSTTPAPVAPSQTEPTETMASPAAAPSMAPAKPTPDKVVAKKQAATAVPHHRHPHRATTAVHERRHHGISHAFRHVGRKLQKFFTGRETIHE